MIGFIIRTTLAMTTFAILMIVKVSVTDRPALTAGEWLGYLILVAIVTEVISRIDRRRSARRTIR